MTELYLIELWSYLDARIDLLGEQESIQKRVHVRRMWSEHFRHEAKRPNLFPTEQVQEVFGTSFVPTYWGTAQPSGEEDL